MRVRTNAIGASLDVGTVSNLTVGMIVRGVASQTANLTEWQDSAGSITASVDASGFIRTNQLINVTSFNNSRLQMSTTGALFDVGTATNVVLRVRGAASQSANLQEWQDSASTVQTLINASGAIATNQRGTFGSTTLSSLGHLSIVQGNAGRVSLAVQNGAGANAADLASYFNASSTVLGGRNAVAQIYSGSTSPILTAVGGATTAASGTGTTATITTTSAHNLAVGDIVTVAGVTPTGYNGTYVLTAVTSTTLSYANATTGSQTVAGTVSAPAQASITARSAGTVGLTLKMASSQSSDAFQILNSSGTVVSKFLGTGELLALSLRTSNQLLIGYESNGGGMLRLAKASASTTPGANTIQLEILAGTNANTFKLVAVAPSGTNYTIVDNMA